ncbi:selenide, water dikinase SelD [Eubacteriales bacterium OttesenSCG-928-K08]|nr:selenide, water dikinase SelD [Eubacteriales bacterium OttesenSCG-928-K08]
MPDIKLTKLANCAGCGAKVGAGELAKLLEGIQTHHDDRLLVGFDKSDDACVYQLNDELALVQTVDFFPPIVDDPYTFGQIAAANALSDIYAMGGEPRLALNLLCVPEDMPKEHVHAILRGGYDKAYEANTIITGGHSIFDPEPKYGLAVTGFVHPEKIIQNSGAKPGDVLLFTKPLGLGILTTAARAGCLLPQTQKYANKLMSTLNKSARDTMINFNVHACTDVTGFGFLGHLYEMANSANVSMEIDTDGVSIIPEALEFAREGLLPAGMYRNRSYAQHAVGAGKISEATQDVLYDPQTSGGLIIAVSPEHAGELFERLREVVPAAQKIGIVTDKKELSIYLK